MKLPPEFTGEVKFRYEQISEDYQSAVNAGSRGLPSPVQAEAWHQVADKILDLLDDLLFEHGVKPVR